MAAQTPRILIVSLLLEKYQDLKRQLGKSYILFHAKNTQEALAILRREKCSAIAVIAAPNMIFDALITIEEIKEKNSLPILGLSAYSREFQQMLNAGATCASYDHSIKENLRQVINR